MQSESDDECQTPREKAKPIDMKVTWHERKAWDQAKLAFFDLDECLLEPKCDEALHWLKHKRNKYVKSSNK